MDTAAKPPLASKISALVDTGAAGYRSPDEAKHVLAELRHEYPEFAKFVEQRFARLPETHQDFLVTLLEAATAQDFAVALQRWSRQSEVPLRVRQQAFLAHEHLSSPVDTQYGEALAQANRLRQQLSAPDASVCTAAGELTTVWRDALDTLPFSLALDVARALTASHPEVAIAILQARQSTTDTQETMALADCIATIPVEQSATLLHHMFTETADKGLQKAIKKSLHRLKAQGVDRKSVV